MFVSSSGLTPEERVQVAASMVDAVTRLAAENEKEKNPKITEKALISALRRRFNLDRRRFSRR